MHPCNPSLSVRYSQMAVPSDPLRRLLRAMGIGASAESPVCARNVGVSSLCAVARPGDHVAIRRCESTEWQHAIFLGSKSGDLTVIQQRPSATIQLTPFDLFMGDHHTLYQCVIIVYDSPDTDASRCRALCRAFAAANMDQLDGTTWKSDCASFAIWCITGSCEPRQSASLTQCLLAQPSQ